MIVKYAIIYHHTTGSEAVFETSRLIDQVGHIVSTRSTSHINRVPSTRDVLIPKEFCG